ncbi:hypothetical protein FPSE_06489 [Fusarium pseudograminearum CS3096]|uniref:Uncharacterized protein n=1 Tax=Fusarium pseudograminearum (strain CS3096) TaxID=1028729 RepID=K3VGE5_FUSPC|nr:hypothetical protein FPSE_06489 [Fusarium pseudograminearum CS3096]EKJ73332.1 hypothetical protein FPSE_06489 [Fusarium pseudograminearum CS3096]
MMSLPTDYSVRFGSGATETRKDIRSEVRGRRWRERSWARTQAGDLFGVTVDPMLDNEVIVRITPSTAIISLSVSFVKDMLCRPVIAC